MEFAVNINYKIIMNTCRTRLIRSLQTFQYNETKRFEKKTKKKFSPAV